jgi:NADH dehydrogenase
MHEAALHGRSTVFWRALLSSFGANRPTPSVKLH